MPRGVYPRTAAHRQAARRVAHQVAQRTAALAPVPDPHRSFGMKDGYRLVLRQCGELLKLIDSLL